MKALIALSVLAPLHLAFAAPDPLITPLAQLHARQDTDPALVGWLSGSGESEFSDRRTCDFPATLSRSGSLAQCCEPNKPCPFFSSCSGGALFAGSTSVFCDNGFCNTGIIVPTAGAAGGESFLGCWATSLGQDPFTLVRDIGDAPVATPTGSGSRSEGSESSETESTTSRRSSSSGAATTTTSGSASGETTAGPTGAGGRVSIAGSLSALGLFVGAVALL